jgi:hypothetical protein
MDNTRTVTDAKQQKIKIKKDVITSSMSTIVDRTCYVFFYVHGDSDTVMNYFTKIDEKCALKRINEQAIFLVSMFSFLVLILLHSLRPDFTDASNTFVPYSVKDEDQLLVGLFCFPLTVIRGPMCRCALQSSDRIVCPSLRLENVDSGDN